jgi:hypothetical protein
MDESVIQTISTILYYIDEYKAGNPDVDDQSMKMIAKQVLKLTSKNKMEFLFYKIMLNIVKLKTVFYSVNAFKDERFVNLSNQYISDLYMYYDYSVFLKNYIKECIKKKEYDHLDDAYILSVKLIQMMQAMSIYTEDINKVIKENCSWYGVCYPKNDYSDIENRKNEIKSLVMTLKKDPE